MPSEASESLPGLLKVPSIDSSLGAVFLGLIVGSMLYGLTLHQTYRYFKLYPKDRPLLKILVITILILETLHTTVWIIASYHYAISEAFNVAGLLHGHWSVRLTFIITGLAVFVCQSFYAYRVYLIGPRYRWLVAPAVVSIVGGLGFALAGGIRSFIIPPYIVDLQQIRWLVSVAYGLAVVTDVTLTSALIFVLGKSRTGWEKTDWVIDTLIKYSVNTGLLTSLASIVSFVFAIVIPGNLVYAGVSIVGAKLYANSVLAMLNSRRSIGSLFEDDFTSYSVPSLPANVHRSHAWRHSPTSVVCRVPESAMSSSLYTSRAVSQEMVFAMGTLH